MRNEIPRHSADRKNHLRRLWARLTGRIPPHCHECGNKISGGMWSEGTGSRVHYRCTDCGPGPGEL